MLYFWYFCPGCKGFSGIPVLGTCQGDDNAAEPSFTSKSQKNKFRDLISGVSPMAWSPTKKNHTQRPPPCVGLENNREPLPYTWGCSAAAVSILVWLLVHDSPTSAHSGQVKVLKTPKVESKEPELSGFGFGWQLEVDLNFFWWVWLCDGHLKWKACRFFLGGKRTNWQIGYGESRLYAK